VTPLLGNRAKLRLPKLWNVEFATMLLVTLWFTKLRFVKLRAPNAEALLGTARVVPPSSAAVPNARIEVRLIMEVSKCCDRQDRSPVWSAITAMTFTQWEFPGR
jgi:hypothetical protein